MSTESTATELWSRARFPSNGMRDEFVEQIRIWNLIEDLPRIEAEPLPDGVGVKFRCGDYRSRGLKLLIDSYGGRLTFHMDGALRQSA